MPASMNSLYRPVRVMSRPVTMPMRICPTLSGIRMRPDAVALTPRTPWAYTGR